MQGSRVAVHAAQALSGWPSTTRGGERADTQWSAQLYLRVMSYHLQLDFNACHGGCRDLKMRPCRAFAATLFLAAAGLCAAIAPRKQRLQ
jgi:hypothetical protein